MAKLRIAVHKFTSCDGCQLSFLNAGQAILTLSQQLEIVHFAEAGYLDEDAKVDIAFVEGSITTPHEKQRIQNIRSQSRHLITLGACATAGGIQALRNAEDSKAWMQAIYASPEWIKTLDESTAIEKHVKVDWQLWGCPVNSRQVMEAVAALLAGIAPRIEQEAVCMECKRKQQVCVMVAKNEPCMGPLTQTGCGALCPSVGRACYACYGPSEKANPDSLAGWFKKYQGLTNEELFRLFQHINNQAPAFKKAGEQFKGIKIVEQKK